MAKPPADRRSPHDDDNLSASVDALAKELRKVVRVGVDRLNPANQRPLLGLASVQHQRRDADYPDNDDGLTLALRDVLTDAVRALGDGPTSDAARLLFGTVPDSRSRNLTERRRLAGNALDVVASTFRKNYEPLVIHDVAAEIVRAEYAPGLTVVNNPDPHNDPAAPAGDPPALHVVIDTPAAAAQALHGPAHSVSARSSVRPWTRRLEWLLLVPAVVGGVGWAWGVGVVLRLVAVAFAVALALTVLGVVRARDEAGGIGRAVLDRLPRLVLLGAATVFFVGAIAAAGTSDTRPPGSDACPGIARDPVCTSTTQTDTTSDAELSPNYVPTTLATVPDHRSPQECPPEGNTERRVSFVGVPPVCVDFDARHTATVETNVGIFEVRLNTELAPYTVNNFAYLARWRFFEGVPLTPDPQPVAVATSMRAMDPVAPDDMDKVPGYGLTFDHNTYPDLRAPEDEPVYVVMTDTYHPNRWAVVLTDAGRSEVELNPERWPLVGQVACGVDVIANNAPGGGFQPAYTSAPIVIEHVTVHELPAQELGELQPRKPCDQ